LRAIYDIFLGHCLFIHRAIAKYIPNLRICVKIDVVPQYFLFFCPQQVSY
jgi:hypothetical protein